jgi:hypothetical protein
MEDAIWRRQDDIQAWRDLGAKGKPSHGGVVINGDIAGNYQDPVLFAYKGRAYIALGCHVFTLPEAWAHWRATEQAYGDFRHSERVDHRVEDRYERAVDMANTILPKAEKAAKKRGWRIN